MAKAKLHIRQTAIQDLEVIWKDTQKFTSIEQADTQYRQIISMLKNIATDFTMGKSLESFRDGYRVFNFENQHIFYRADQDDLVEIIRILG